MSPVAKEVHIHDSVGAILNHTDFLSHDQGQMLGPELNLAAEMSEGEYSHLQQLIQTHIETNESDMTDQSTATMKDATVLSPLSTTQAIDLSTSASVHDLGLPGEKTPLCYGEVPSFVLAKIKGEEFLAAPPDNSRLPTQTRGPCTARVCLEKRFNSIAGTSMGPEDLQSAVLSKSLTTVQQPTDTQDASSHSLLQKWFIGSERSNEMVGPYIGIYNPVTNICGPVIRQISHLEPNPQQGLIIPKGFPLSLCPERALANNSFASGTSRPQDRKTSPLAQKRDQGNKSKASKETPDSAGVTGSSVKKRPQQVVPPSLRRERHNSKERERRKRIRLCCDELNMLVPFCQADTDKVTTLQWTTTYLRYVSKMYGDTIKEEFQKTFADKNGLKTKPSAVNDLILQDTENIPMAVEP